MPKKHLDQMGKNFKRLSKDYGVNPALFKSLYQDVKTILQRRANEAEEGNGQLQVKLD
jgi:hypothetical protein